MKNTTKLEVTVRMGALSSLFRTHLKRGNLPISADALMAFLTTDGRWDTRLGQLLVASTVGSERNTRILSFGQSPDGDFVTDFHARVGKLPNSEILAHRGQAIYVKGASLEVPSYGYAFRDVIWGIIEYPDDIRSALSKALVVASQQLSPTDENMPFHLVLPIHGSVGTTLPIHDEDDRLRFARNFVHEQVMGLRNAVRFLERPVQVTALYQSDSIPWAGIVAQAAKQAHLADFAELTFGAPL